METGLYTITAPNGNFYLGSTTRSFKRISDRKGSSRYGQGNAEAHGFALQHFVLLCRKTENSLRIHLEVRRVTNIASHQKASHCGGLFHLQQSVPPRLMTESALTAALAARPFF